MQKSDQKSDEEFIAIDEIFEFEVISNASPGTPKSKKRPILRFEIDNNTGSPDSIDTCDTSYSLSSDKKLCSTEMKIE